MGFFKANNSDVEREYFSPMTLPNGIQSVLQTPVTVFILYTADCGVMAIVNRAILKIGGVQG